MQTRPPGQDPLVGKGGIQAARVDLSALLPDVNLPSDGTWPIRHLTIDSREVIPGSVFIAVPGERTDGHVHIPEALQKGAAVVFHQADERLGIDCSLYPWVTFIPVPDTRRLGRRLAPAFYGFPSRAMRVVAITGTNGKTTCSCLLEAIYQALGRRTGLINTFGVRYPGASLKLANYVPEPVRLQRLLFDMAATGVDSLVLEVSSQALADERLCGIELDSAILTNVTPEHLDAHGTMEEYLEAKLLLFDVLGASRKPQKAASIWKDCWGFSMIAGRVAQASAEACVHFIGPEEDSSPGGFPNSLRADNILLEQGRSSFVLHRQGASLRCETSLLGRFNVLNILAALAGDPEFLDAICATDTHTKQVLDAALAETVVPGRLQSLPNSLRATVFVDYAHTEDSLEQVLGLLHGLPHRALYTVFGCGGDRDRGKRPKMGAVASRYSDLVFLTADNPRTEEPGAIIEAIAAGFGGKRNYLVVEDREEAIAGAIDLLTEGDILLIAGKGHESSQVIGAEELSFSDVEVACKHLSRRGRSQ